MEGGKGRNNGRTKSGRKRKGENKGKLEATLMAERSKDYVLKMSLSIEKIMFSLRNFELICV